MAFQDLELSIRINIGTRYFRAVNHGNHCSHIKPWSIQGDRVGLLQAHAHPASGVDELFVQTFNECPSHRDRACDTNNNARKRHQSHTTGDKLSPK